MRCNGNSHLMLLALLISACANQPSDPASELQAASGTLNEFETVFRADSSLVAGSGEAAAFTRHEHR